MRFADLLRQRRVTSSDPSGVDDDAPTTAGDDDGTIDDRMGEDADSGSGGSDSGAQQEPDGESAQGAAPVSAPAPQADGPSTQSTRRAERSATVEAASSDAPPSRHPLVTRLADTVADFCNSPGIGSSDSWTVRLPLRADVLPQTTLQMTLSPHWLALRFEILDDASRQLVSRHQESLARQLESKLDLQREISIDID